MEDSVQENIVKRHLVPIVLGGIGLLCVGYGALQLLPQKQEQPDILFEAASDISPLAKKTTATKKNEEVTVDVAGAVEKPGVYPLKRDSRLQDALIAAGGLSAKANRERVAKELNLAAKVTDGAKVYVPFIGEHVSVGGGGSTVGGSMTSGGSLVNINIASTSELETLPGIGAVTAGKIISGRPYGAVEELVEKKVVGKSVFEKIKEQVSVY